MKKIINFIKLLFKKESEQKEEKTIKTHEENQAEIRKIMKETREYLRKQNYKGNLKIVVKDEKGNQKYQPTTTFQNTSSRSKNDNNSKTNHQNTMDIINLTTTMSDNDNNNCNQD